MYLYLYLYACPHFIVVILVRRFEYVVQSNILNLQLIATAINLNVFNVKTSFVILETSKVKENHILMFELKGMFGGIKGTRGKNSISLPRLSISWPRLSISWPRVSYLVATTYYLVAKS